MQKVLTATYQNGVLILNEKMSQGMEGKTFKVIIREEIDTETKKQRFFQNVNNYAFQLPNDYKFNREELYER
jgi:predicted DNA-binding antitoxin AbrB/MazE fold protein